jgi:ribosome-binding factor A
VKQFRRADRVGEEILRIISHLFEGELTGHWKGLVTFTQVRLTGDLRYATVYFSHLGDTEELPGVLEYFQRENKPIRYLVGRQLRIRHIPELKFKFDPSIEEGVKIERLLNEIKSDKDNS